LNYDTVDVNLANQYRIWPKSISCWGFLFAVHLG